MTRAEGSERREVIAHFSWPFLVFSVLVWFLSIWIICLFWQEAILNLHPGTKLRLDAWFIVLFSIPFVLWTVIAGVRLLYFVFASKGEALWLEAGRLTYADRKKLDVSTNEIASMEWAYNGPPVFPRKMNPELRVLLKNGDGAAVRLNLFSENKGDVIAALEEKLGLTISERL